MEEKTNQDYVSILREHGLQVTYQRVTIFKILSHLKGHPSCEDIYKQVKKRFPMISLATIYKTLECFHDAGLIKKASPLAQTTRYDANISEHHHLICLKCQAIEDIDDPLPGRKLLVPEGTGFHVLRHQVLVQGYCRKCRRLMSGQKKPASKATPPSRMLDSAKASREEDQAVEG